MSKANRAELLTLLQMALELRVSVEWLRKESAGGRIPCLRAGDRLLFNRRAVTRAVLRRAARTRREEVQS